VVLGNNAPQMIQLGGNNQRVVYLQPISASSGPITFLQASPHTKTPDSASQPQPNVSFVQQPIFDQSSVKTEQHDSTTPDKRKFDEGVGVDEGRRAKTSFSNNFILPNSSSPMPPPTPPMAANGNGNGGHLHSSSRGCNCSKSKCLKLYCECFRRGEYCAPNCQCNNCHNKEEYNDLRQKAVRLALDRNEDAFKPKVAKSGKQVNKKGKHLRGCNCKRSGCLKKYCECYQAGVACYELCNCIGCKNREDQDPLADYGAPSSKRAKVGVSRVLQSNLTGPVISAATTCLLKASKSKQRCGASKLATDAAVLEQFGKSLREIITFTINQQRESNPLARFPKPN